MSERQKSSTRTETYNTENLELYCLHEVEEIEIWVQLKLSAVYLFTAER
jgi:hypothetical protein